VRADVLESRTGGGGGRPLLEQAVEIEPAVLEELVGQHRFGTVSCELISRTFAL
jgi:hypothetical protein